jgi:uncharacterized protein with beta-barrel porin domain
MASLGAGYRGRQSTGDFASYLRLDAAQATLRGFSESDGRGDALHYQRQTLPSLSVVAGAEASSRIGSRFGVLVPRGRIELRHDLDRTAVAPVGYADDRAGPLYSTLVGGSRQNTLSMSLDATLAFRDGWSVGSGYQLDLSNQARTTRVDLRLSRGTP